MQKDLKLAHYSAFVSADNHSQTLTERIFMQRQFNSAQQTTLNNEYNINFKNMNFMKKSWIFCFLLLGVNFSLPLCAQNKGYEKSIEVGYAVGIGEYNNDIINLSMINGYRINDNFYAGLGVGVGYSNAITYVDIKYGITNETRSDAFLIPIFAHLKANLTSGDISPFFSFNIGYTIDVNSYLKDAPGLMLQPNFGVDFRVNEKTSIYGLIGLNLQHYDYTYTYNLGTTSSNWEVTQKSELFKAIDLKIGFKF